jgi:hypothetical protein
VGEEGFQEEGGSDLVDDVAAVDFFAAGAAGEACVVAVGVKESVGFLGGVALVEKMVSELWVLFAEDGGEGEGFYGLRAGCAVGVERIADDEDFDFVLADETGDRFEVGTLGGAVDGEEWAREDAELVCDGEADAAVADVEREGAGCWHG